ncbi:MAG: PIN domain-containing protein [Bacteroidales bacterium]|nr:PIN domain-containing protein [Candidatus Minthousia equi]
MINALLDTNVLLDYLLQRGEKSKYAVTILQLANAGFIKLYVTDLSIANIAYITRKEIKHEDFFRIMKILQKYYTIIPIGAEVVNRALNEEWDDFEDSLQCYSAEACGLSHIITNNIKDFAKSKLDVCSPSDFVNDVTK